MRVLIPLIWLCAFVSALAGNMVTATIDGSHHIYWRQMIFGSCLVMLASVTGIKTRRR